MQVIPKRLLLAGVAPFALAAVYGGSLAFAQSGEPTPAPTQDSAPESPATPAPIDPETAPDDTRRGCPEKGGAGGSESSDSAQPDTSTQLRSRSGARSASPF